MKTVTVNYDIEGTGLEKKILLLTDIHYYHSKHMKRLNKLLDEIKKLDGIDYICLSGDIIDVGTIKDMDLFINWLKELTKISSVIMSLGSHDICHSKKNKSYYYNEEYYNKVKAIDKLHLLDNEVFEDGKIRFVGLTMPIDFYYKYKENTNYFMRYVNNTFKELDNKKYNILLSHTPVPITNTKEIDSVKLLKNTNLVLSGHTHAGCVPTFLRKAMKGRGILAPCKEKMFPKDAYGLITRDNMKIVISSGITKVSKVSRLEPLNNFYEMELSIVNLLK
jgi:predicted MPP superfamily phosphohydrolase